MLIAAGYREMVEFARFNRTSIAEAFEDEMSLTDELDELTDSDVAELDAYADALTDAAVGIVPEVSAVDPRTVVGSPERIAALDAIAERIARGED